MNGCRVKYWGLAAVLALAGAGAAAAQPTLNPPPAPTRSPVTTAAIASAEAKAPYPGFTSIPTYPKDLRSVAAWKKSVTSLQGEGADLTHRVGAMQWTLNDTEVWAADERAIATPPPPMGTGDTEAFAAALRARATPPPPLHHAAGATPASHP